RLPVLEQLDVVPEPGQVDEADVRARDARDLLDVAALDLPVGDEREAEAAVEVERAVGVGDRQREVVDARDHSECLRRRMCLEETLKRPSGSCTEVGRRGCRRGWASAGGPASGRWAARAPGRASALRPRPARGPAGASPG